jgi:hypothetical protein
MFYIQSDDSLIMVKEGYTASFTKVHEKTKYELLGEYLCSTDYWNDEYFKVHPTSVPSITFFKDKTCKLRVNYMHGVCVLNGTYAYTDWNCDFISVTVDLRNTVFESPGKTSASYSFRVDSNDRVVAVVSFTGTNAGDPFVRVSTT